MACMSSSMEAVEMSGNSTPSVGCGDGSPLVEEISTCMNACTLVQVFLFSKCACDTDTEIRLHT